jgi:hypothetical protein
MFFNRRKWLYSKGDRVRVAIPEKIKMTLDKENKLDGLLFMDHMWQYCGKEATIKKIFKYFEHNKLSGPGFTILRVKAPIYMLNGIICNGNSELLEDKCDLNCHHMWHEAWLEKV